MAIDIEHLPEDPKILQKMVLDLTAQLDRESVERHKVETILRELLEARRNRKSEQLSADQLALFAAIWDARQKTETTKPDEEPKDQDNDPKPESDSSPKKKQKNGGGRQPLSPHLKRERIVHDLQDTEKHCAVCAQDLRPIGEESSERYEYIPAQVIVVEDVCKKYACECTVKTATKPPQPIEKSTAGASLLAQIIVGKFAAYLLIDGATLLEDISLADRFWADDAIPHPNEASLLHSNNGGNGTLYERLMILPVPRSTSGFARALTGAKGISRQK